MVRLFVVCIIYRGLKEFINLTNVDLKDE